MSLRYRESHDLNKNGTPRGLVYIVAQGWLRIDRKGFKGKLIA